MHLRVQKVYLDIGDRPADWDSTLMSMALALPESDIDSRLSRPVEIVEFDIQAREEAPL
jgi:hypothetical protein